jgi:hypothetical protein
MTQRHSKRATHGLKHDLDAHIPLGTKKEKRELDERAIKRRRRCSKERKKMAGGGVKGRREGAVC